jgi:hypothetical protein
MRLLALKADFGKQMKLGYLLNSTKFPVLQNSIPLIGWFSEC